MKRLLLTVALLATWGAQGQPLLRNSLTTNTLGTNLVWAPLAGTLSISSIGPGLVLYNTAGGANNKLFYLSSVANSFQLNWASDDSTASRTLGYFDTNGNFQVRGFVGMSDTTNQLTVTNDVLLLDGVPVSGTATTPVNNFWTTNIFYQSGKGNTLIITQALTIQALKTNLLATTSSGLITQAVYGSGIAWDPSTLTLSATASGGDTTGTNIVTLTMSGTNVDAMDFSLVRGGGTFKLVLTGNGYMPAPANVATSPFSKAWLMVQQPSTGTCVLTWTNMFAWSQGSPPVIDTNNGSVSVFEFISDVFTNGVVHGSATALSRRP